MKVIETVYKGYRFRSRLEARWAVCLDALKIDWVYEPEGYEFDNGERYLPDFYLPTLRLWIEVKPQNPTEDELRKVQLLVLGLNQPAFITNGLPDQLGIGCYINSRGQIVSGTARLLLAPMWSRPAYMDLTGRRPEHPDHQHDLPYPLGCVQIGHTDGILPFTLPESRTAIETARSARFEFGECGVPA